MSGKPGANVTRVCILCGEQFHPNSTRQKCCNKIITVPCVICGKPVEQICTTKPQPKTCSKECTTALGNIGRSVGVQNLVKTCKYCGREFVPKSARSEYCEGPHYANCQVCGKQFEIRDILRPSKTCSDQCKFALSVQHRDLDAMQTTLKATMLERYGVENAMYLPNSVKKMKTTCQQRYGVDSYTQTDEYKQRVKLTDLKKYGVEHHLQAKEVIDKRTITVQQRYGDANVFSSEYGKAKIKDTLLEKYGVTNPSKYPEFKQKATASAKNSNLECRIANLLNQYNIDYIPHYFLSSDDLTHEYDFYIPKYKILVDADGTYYHSYLSDPDGRRVRDDYDDIRLSIVPEDHIFHLIVEGYEDKGIKDLVNIIQSIDSGVFDYDSMIFQWCRSIGFPYPSYTLDRMKKDYKSLCAYSLLATYNPNSRLGESIIRNYHKSIYSAHCRHFPSPLEGWNDDTLLKKTILNRFIYVNDVDPSKVLRGLYISKLAPRVSIFNPVLSKYLTLKYLSEFDTVFDPFSGYSGRLLGVVSTGKTYIGQDINLTNVAESNSIIADLSLPNCAVSCADMLSSTGQYDCLLTCPPYSTKEIYGDELVFKSCDDWITECLNRFNCQRYVFVVDNTTIYSDYVIESIQTTSHLNSVQELVVVIDK